MLAESLSSIGFNFAQTLYDEIYIISDAQTYGYSKFFFKILQNGCYNLRINVLGNLLLKNIYILKQSIKILYYSKTK